MSHKGFEWRLCLEHLPKPRWYREQQVVACPQCNKLFVCHRGYVDFGWVPYFDPKWDAYIKEMKNK